MSGLREVTERAAGMWLEVLGALHTEAGDGVGAGTIILLGPREPGFWAHVSREPEFMDKVPDPMDRWSVRVIGGLARQLGGTPLFPFGDPPRPFIGWALRSGRAWSSPVGLLVHDTAGLLVSFRGAVLLPDQIAIPETSTSPCLSCKDKPCLTACPVGALTADGYDLPGCHDYLDQDAGEDCMSSGCAVRRACPISRSYPRDPAQSAFHMAAFHPARTRAN